MNKLIEIENLKFFFRQHNLRPKDYMGQNFLVDQEVLQKIVEAADLTKNDTVLEIGSGLGVLTSELIKAAGKVIAVEKDEKIFRILNSELRETQNHLILINQDILKFNIFQHITGPYKVVANIPYYLTSKLIQNFLTTEPKPSALVLMVQKEVGERIAAKPGELSVLGISVQFFADAEIVAQVPKEFFWPQPKVDSCIIRIVPKNKYPEVKDQKLFFRIIKVAFAGKRKQIVNTLSNGLGYSKIEIIGLLKSLNLDPSLRPQDLSLNDWISLYKKLKM